ncbi:trimethylamine methyltransferase family protein [Candidatus Bipolaricaulota bacterium]|nr:trimethylamine methyltransferase family protein [Candidatus Bipolaricaulota bacterium]
MNENKERLFGRANVLSEEELERIHEATLYVLGQVGVVFEDRSARDILRKAGASVQGELVKFPAELINESIEKAPLHVVLGARDPEKSITLGHGRMLTTNGFGASQVLDYETKTYRNATAKDMKDLTVLADYLDNVDYCQHQVTAQDVPPELSDVAQAFILLSNTGKHGHLSTYNAEYLDEVITLGEIVSDRDGSHGVPAYSLGCTPISPLRYALYSTVTMRRAVKRNIPFLIVSGIVGGVSAPITLAGALVVQNAEILAGITLAQSISPGAPIVYGSFTSPMDARTGKQLLGIPELPLINMATAQVCKHYHIPFGYGTGGVTDSFLPGVQAGFEKSFTALLGALGGVEVIHDAVSGILASGRVVSYEQMILDNELCTMLRHFLKGIAVNDNSLALDVIEQIGPAGNYLTSRHTTDNFRKELYLSKLWQREQPSTTGEEILFKQAATRVKEILASHSPLPLSADQVKEMKTVWQRVGLDKAMGDALGPHIEA